MAEEPLPPFEQECFFITPIGEKGSRERERADGVLAAIVRPAVEALELTPVRADLIGRPGQITTEVIDHVRQAKAAVADLSDRNPNVYWELGVRHALRLPVVLIADEKERGAIPFDLFQMNTIFYEESFQGTVQARTDIAKHLQEALGGAIDSPVAASEYREKLAEGSPVERTLAELVKQVESLTAAVGRRPAARGIGAAPNPYAFRRLGTLTRRVRDVAAKQDDADLTESVEQLSELVDRLVARHGYVRGAKSAPTRRRRVDPELLALMERLAQEARAEVAEEVAEGGADADDGESVPEDEAEAAIGSAEDHGVTDDEETA